MKQITWKFTTVGLDRIIPWQDNPRQIRRGKGDKVGNAELLEESHEDFGQADPLLLQPINSDGFYELLDGHQRWAVWAEKYGKSFKAKVAIASRELSFTERKKLVAFLHEGATGKWDLKKVAALFSAEELDKWLMPDWVKEGVTWDREPSFDYDIQVEDDDETLPEQAAGNDSAVVMVILFLNMETEPRFRNMVMELSKVYGVENITDCVHEVVKEQYEAINS